MNSATEHEGGIEDEPTPAPVTEQPSVPAKPNTVGLDNGTWVPDPVKPKRSQVRKAIKAKIKAARKSKKVTKGTKTKATGKKTAKVGKMAKKRPIRKR